MLKILIVSVIFLTGCATQHIAEPINEFKIIQPLPQKLPCDYKVAGKCKQSTATEISGATTLGHLNEEPKINP
jgi:hypothetical protein